MRIIVNIPRFRRYTRVSREGMADDLVDILVNLLLKARFSMPMYDRVVERFAMVAKEKRPEAIAIDQSRRPYTTD